MLPCCACLSFKIKSYQPPRSFYIDFNNSTCSFLMMQNFQTQMGLTDNAGELKRFHPFSWKHFHILVILSLRGYNWFYSNCFSIQIPVPDKQVKDYKIIYGMTTDACMHHERIFQNVHLCPKYRQNNLKHSIFSNFAVLLYTIIRLVVQRNATVVV